MNPRIKFQPRLTAVFALFFLISALPMAWLLHDDSWSRLNFTRQEISALKPLGTLNRSMLSGVEDSLMAHAMPARERDQLFGFSQAWVNEAKGQGNRSKLILDPRQDIFHLAYLCTVKLPERFLALTELGLLESQGAAGGIRGSYLLQLLFEQLGEEERALDLALEGRDDSAARAILEKTRQRRAALREYRPGEPLRLRETARQASDFWDLCLTSLERSLHELRSSQQNALRARMALAFALPGILLWFGWLLARRFAETQVGEVAGKVAQNYQMLYQSIPLPVFIYDLATRRFVDANPAASLLLKTPAEQIVGQSLSSFIAPAEREAFIEKLKSRDPDKDVHENQRIQDAEGKAIEVEIFARSIRLEGRKLRLVMLKDISETLSAQEALKKSEELHRALIENTQDPVMIYHHDRTVSYENPAAMTAAVGYSHDELKSMGAFDLLHPDDLPVVLASAERYQRGEGQQSQVEIRLRAKNGDWKIFDARTVNLSDNAVVNGVLVHLRDVSASREGQKQLMRLERLAAIGQTAAGLAHEVRNPLAAITMSAEFLKLQLEDKPSLLPELDSIMRQSTRLKNLVNEVLERSKSEDLELSEVSSADLFKSALGLARARFGQAGDRVDVVFKAPQNPPRLNVDSAQMERVLSNLVINAMQAVSSSGAVVLELAGTEGGVEFRVSDNGPGVPEARLSKIFEPFFTTKETGSGLGLWICKSIVEQHGGVIAAENLAPRGCRFTVRLPLVPPKTL